MQFFMGLLPSLLASVLVLWSVWALLRLEQTGRTKWSMVAVLFGTLAVATHVIAAVLWLAALVAYGGLSVRRRWRQTVLMAFVSLLPGIIYDNEAQFAASPSDGVLVVRSGRWRLYQRADSVR